MIHTDGVYTWSSKIYSHSGQILIIKVWIRNSVWISPFHDSSQYAIVLHDSFLLWTFCSTITYMPETIPASEEQINPFAFDEKKSKMCFKKSKKQLDQTWSPFLMVGNSGKNKD